MSNASRGAYFKARTREYLKKQGFEVAELEVIRWVWRPNKTRMPVKHDQLGADLLAVNGEKVVFVQVKGGEQAVGAGQFPAAQRELLKYPCPASCEQWILAWAPRSREPRIIVVGRTTPLGF